MKFMLRPLYQPRKNPSFLQKTIQIEFEKSQIYSCTYFLVDTDTCKFYNMHFTIELQL
jgi:hypothetical protein